MRAASAHDESMRRHRGAGDVQADTKPVNPDEVSMQARKRRRIALELDLARRATERAAEASRRASNTGGLPGETHRRAAGAQDRAAQAHRDAADVQRNHLALEEELYGRKA